MCVSSVCIRMSAFREGGGIIRGRRLGILSKVTALLYFVFIEKERRLITELCSTELDMSTGLLLLTPPFRLGDVFDPVCCSCLITNPLERDYSTRQGESVEAKK